MSMNTIKLTPANASTYIGHEIIFTYFHNHFIKRILRVSDTGETIYIDHPGVKNNLQIVSRKVLLII